MYVGWGLIDRGVLFANFGLEERGMSGKGLGSFISAITGTFSSRCKTLPNCPKLVGEGDASKCIKFIASLLAQFENMVIEGKFTINLNSQ